MLHLVSLLFEVLRKPDCSLYFPSQGCVQFLHFVRSFLNALIWLSWQHILTYLHILLIPDRSIVQVSGIQTTKLHQFVIRCR